MAITSFFRLATAIALLLCYITVQIECDHKTLKNHDPPPINFRPIIGILTVGMRQRKLGSPGTIYKEHIPAPYVKFIEGGGARVVPIRIGRPRMYYKRLMFQINGIFFPDDHEKSHEKAFLDSVRMIHKYADQINDAGIYFPLWSMLEGFPIMITTLTQGKQYLRDCPKEDHAYFSRVGVNRRSKMFRSAPVGVFNHISRPEKRSCITREDFEKIRLNKEYRVISSTVDDAGSELISDVEHIRKPYYSTQLNPHAVLYEWRVSHMVKNHSRFIRSSQYLANFFANEARKNNNHFRNAGEESENLIYNYNSYKSRQDGDQTFYVFDN